MRLGIMQPYFFPYPGHFGLIASVDEWVVFDVTQYTPKTWMNRNRVLHPKEGTSWVSLPLLGASMAIATHEARLVDPAAAARSVLGKLSHYRPHVRRHRYDAACGLVEAAFMGEGDSLVEVNARGLAACCAVLGIPFRYRICSALGIDLPSVPGAGGWAPAICAALGAGAYVNPAGGRSLFDPAAFRRVGVELFFAETAPLAYDTGPYAPQPGLSILDALMWNDAARVADAIRAGTVLTRG